MPRPTKDTVRGELLPSAWILQPDTIDGEAVTRVIYMIQVGMETNTVHGKAVKQKFKGVFRD